jgi:hypothetical protein
MPQLDHMDEVTRTKLLDEIGRNIASPNVCLEHIPSFSYKEKYNIYIKNVIEDYNRIKLLFPLLKLCILPTKELKCAFIYGLLIPQEMYNLDMSNTDLCASGIEIMSIYPKDFPEKNVTVIDTCRKINWNDIPTIHWHINYININGVELCTHHEWEINTVKPKDRTSSILTSAWKLYFQCRIYPKTKEWVLKDLRHGKEGESQLKKEGICSGRRYI